MTVDLYLQSLPDAQHKCLQQLREEIKALVPQAEETISYGMPAFKQNGILVYYAAFTHHMSLFVIPKVLDQVRPMLGDRSTTKSAIHFTETDPIPLAVVEKVYRFAIGRNRSQVDRKKSEKTNQKIKYFSRRKLDGWHTKNTRIRTGRKQPMDRYPIAHGR